MGQQGWCALLANKLAKQQAVPLVGTIVTLRRAALAVQSRLLLEAGLWWLPLLQHGLRGSVLWARLSSCCSAEGV